MRQKSHCSKPAATERSPHGYSTRSATWRSTLTASRHAPDAKVERWQQRLEPLNKRLAGGCHLTRRIPDFIEEAGLTLTQLDTYYFEGEPKPFGYTYEGQALKV